MTTDKENMDCALTMFTFFQKHYKRDDWIKAILSAKKALVTVLKDLNINGHMALYTLLLLPEWQGAVLAHRVAVVSAWGSLVGAEEGAAVRGWVRSKGLMVGGACGCLSPGSQQTQVWRAEPCAVG